MTLQENQNVSPPVSARCEWTFDQEKTMVEMLDHSQSANKHHNGFIGLIWNIIATTLKGTEGSSKVKTGDMCHSHWNVLSRRYKDAKQLVDENGASWNNETNMIELSGERWTQIITIPTSTNKRLGWFRGKSFPLYDAVGAVVEATPIHIPFAPGDRLARYLLEHELSSKSPSEHSISYSSDESDQEVIQVKLESDSPHSLSTSSMADSSISSNKSAKKRKVREDESAPNDDDRERSNSIVSSVRSSGPARNKPPKSTAQLFIDSMNSMQDKFMNQIKAEQTASTSGNVTRSLDYLVLAVRVIRKMKNIDRGFLFKALDLFKDQPQTAKIFVILESEELRIGWLKYQFEKLW